MLQRVSKLVEQRLHLPGARFYIIGVQTPGGAYRSTMAQLSRFHIRMSVRLSPESHQAGRVANGRALITHLQMQEDLNKTPAPTNSPILTAFRRHALSCRQAGLLASRAAPCARPAAARPPRPGLGGGSARRPRPSMRRRASRLAASKGLCLTQQGGARAGAWPAKVHAGEGTAQGTWAGKPTQAW